MTDIACSPVARTRTARSPLAAVTAAVSRLLRSYSDAIAKDSFIVPDGRMAYAARQLPAHS